MSTISAIATALGNKGINIIRISGEDSLKVINNIFTNNKNIEPNKIIFGSIKNKEEILDNVLVSYFKSPNSYTGEDVIEINCHGGTYITNKILDLVLDNGADLAEPGEFSKRAFLNGKIDLSGAESVIDLITSKTSLEAKIATNDMNGKIYEAIKELREKIIEILAHISVSIDYPEYDYEEVEEAKLKELLNKEINDIEKLINSYNEGKFIKNGVNVAIIGRPNVGKSSLLNAFLKEDRAIVTDVAGTTRDTIEESINIGDLILNMTDTAGIRETEDVIEKIGVEKSLKKIEEVDLVIYMLNVSECLSKDEKQIISNIQNKGIKSIYVINKMDEVQKSKYDVFLEELKENNINKTIDISVKENDGIELIKKEIKEMFLNDDIISTNEIIIVNQRHKELLKKSNDLLIDVKNQIENNTPIDILSINLKQSAKYLGEIIGLDVNSDVINKIFEKFCLGK